MIANNRRDAGHDLHMRGMNGYNTPWNALGHTVIPREMPPLEHTMAPPRPDSVDVQAPYVKHQNMPSSSRQETSPQRHFGFIEIDKERMPYILRHHEQYIAVRVLESSILACVPTTPAVEKLLTGEPLSSFHITDAEAELMNDININHCNQSFGRSSFSTEDCVVRVSDFKEFYTKLKAALDESKNCKHSSAPSSSPEKPPAPGYSPQDDVVDLTNKKNSNCRKNATSPETRPSSQTLDGPDGGWLQVNNTVMPYVIRGRQKLVPLSVVRYSAGLLLEVPISAISPTVDECDFINTMCMTSNLNFNFASSAKLMRMYDLQKFSTERVRVIELPKDKPFEHATYTDMRKVSEQPSPPKMSPQPHPTPQQRSPQQPMQHPLTKQPSPPKQPEVPQRRPVPKNPPPLLSTVPPIPPLIRRPEDLVPTSDSTARPNVPPHDPRVAAAMWMNCLYMGAMGARNMSPFGTSQQEPGNNNLPSNGNKSEKRKRSKSDDIGPATKQVSMGVVHSNTIQAVLESHSTGSVQNGGIAQDVSSGRSRSVQSNHSQSSSRPNGRSSTGSTYDVSSTVTNDLPSQGINHVIDDIITNAIKSDNMKNNPTKKVKSQAPPEPPTHSEVAFVDLTGDDGEIMPWFFESRYTSVMMVGRWREPCALLEALHLYFSSYTMWDFKHVVETVIGVKLIDMSAAQERRFISYYKLPTKRLKCKKMIRMKDFVKHFPQIKQIFQSGKGAEPFARSPASSSSTKRTDGAAVDRCSSPEKRSSPHVNSNEYAVQGPSHNLPQSGTARIPDVPRAFPSYTEVSQTTDATAHFPRHSQTLGEVSPSSSYSVAEAQNTSHLNRETHQEPVGLSHYNLPEVQHSSTGSAVPLLNITNSSAIDLRHRKPEPAKVIHIYPRADNSCELIAFPSDGETEL